MVSSLHRNHWEVWLKNKCPIWKGQKPNWYSFILKPERTIKKTTDYSGEEVPEGPFSSQRYILET